ncbi:hypothetical protein [Micromonospora sp. NPDC005174]|uniref:hypothetical protein n=1 Tax=unclassified Micromonospora TaxID=2617518 RepID=UPI0033A9E4E4
MPAVVVLALTLALAPTPTPSVSVTPGPIGELVGGVGRIVGELLGGDGTPTPTPSPTGTRAPTTGPSRPSTTGPSSPSTPAAPAGSQSGGRAVLTPDRPGKGAGADDRDAAVPLRGGDTPAPVVAPSLADPVRDGWPPVSYLLVAVLLVVLAALLLRRRGDAAAPAPPTPDTEPTLDHDPDPGADNVRRLPTSLNAVYELGRLDERLEQERRRRP